MKWPTIWLNGYPTRNPVDWLGAFVALAASVANVVMVLGIVLLIPVGSAILLYRYFT